jgi:hypothetical protein
VIAIPNPFQGLKLLDAKPFLTDGNPHRAILSELADGNKIDT